MADEIKTCRDLDEQLTPYVDGEQAVDTRRAVEAHLAGCPPCHQHADTERAARDVVHEHKHELRGAAPPALRARCAALGAATIVPASRPARAGAVLRRWAPLSLAATLVLAIAGVIAFGLNDRVEALAASLAVDHVKCFKVGSITASHADPSIAANDWRRDQGWPILVPDSAPAQQLTLVDVRRCFTTDGRAAHMMYRWRGKPLSLYVLPENTGGDRVVDRLRHEAVIWCANNRTYAVVAEGHPQDLPLLVDYLKAHVK